jgi:hypothetical protein
MRRYTSVEKSSLGIKQNFRVKNRWDKRWIRMTRSGNGAQSGDEDEF